MARDDAEDSSEVTLEDKIAKVSKKTSTHFWVSIAMLPLMLAVFFVGLVLLVNGHKATSSIVAEKPENKVEMFSEKIKATHTQVEKQYAKHLAKMDDDSIFSVNEKFRVLYQVSKESEVDYLAFLNVYQTLMYDMASRIRGSGEWFHYYERQLKAFNQKAAKREQELRTYLDSK